MMDRHTIMLTGREHEMDDEHGVSPDTPPRDLAEMSLEELWRLYQGLRPEFQAYVFRQIRQLLELQKVKAES